MKWNEKDEQRDHTEGAHSWWSNDKFMFLPYSLLNKSLLACLTYVSEMFMPPVVHISPSVNCLLTPLPNHGHTSSFLMGIWYPKGWVSSYVDLLSLIFRSMHYVKIAHLTYVFRTTMWVRLCFVYTCNWQRCQYTQKEIIRRVWIDVAFIFFYSSLLQKVVVKIWLVFWTWSNGKLCFFIIMRWQNYPLSKDQLLQGGWHPWCMPTFSKLF